MISRFLIPKEYFSSFSQEVFEPIEVTLKQEREFLIDRFKNGNISQDLYEEHLQEYNMLLGDA